jgi:translation initiation factor 1 (eIF-1/SUI1)
MPQKKRFKVDISAPASPLTDNHFAKLSAQGLPPGEPPEQPDTRPTPPARPYRVAKTAKGGYHLSIEKRAAGKVVTIIHRVEGDGDALARELKKHCGVGGTFADTTIELQGDVRAKVEPLLKKWLG